MSFLNDSMEPRATNSNVSDDLICDQIEFLDEGMDANIENSPSLLNFKKNRSSNKLPINKKLKQQKRKRVYRESDSDDILEDYESSPIIHEKKMFPQSNRMDILAITPKSKIKMNLYRT